MRTKRFFGSAIAMLCMIAIIGSGFALWVFQYKENATQSDIGLSVEQAVNVGSVTPAGSFSINFDQTKKPNGWNTGLNNTSNGISIIFATDASTVASYDTTATDIEENMAVKFTVAITISADLAEYIDFTTTNTEFDKSVTDNVIYFTSTSASQFDWSNVKITYTKEPSNYTDYTTFAGVVSASTISVTYTAEVVGATISN